MCDCPQDDSCCGDGDICPCKEDTQDENEVEDD